VWGAKRRREVACWRWFLEGKRMRQTPTLDLQLERDPLATIAVSAAPVVLEGRYRLLMRALWQLRHSRRTRWGVGLGSGARPLVEPAHDLAVPRDAGVGVRLRLLARPRGGVLHPPRHARTGLLVPARASVSLRRCRSRSATDRASGRSHPGRRRNRRPRRLGCRNIAGACCLCFHRRPGSLRRSSRPALRHCLAHRTVASARSDRSLKATPRRWLIAFWAARKTPIPLPERSGEAERERAPVQRAVPELSPNHGELAQPRSGRRGQSLAVSIACPI
jgi:hypothetical protein